MIRSVRLAAVVTWCAFAHMAWAQGPSFEVFCDVEQEESCAPDTLEIRFETKDGSSVREAEVGDEIRAVVVLDTVSERIRTWSLAVSHDPAVLTILPDTVTMRETDGGEFVDAIRGIFDITIAVDGGTDFPPGFMSAVVVDFAIRADADGGVGGFLDGLPAGRTNSLAFASYRVTGEIPAEGTLLRLADGVVRNAPSPPVSIRLNVNGIAHRPEMLRHGAIRRAGAPPNPRFRRGDVDGDGQLSIADAVLVVQLVAGRIGGDDPRAACLDAFDADDDGALRLADAVALLGYQFARDAPPPAPFPDCGVDETVDELDCPIDSPPGCQDSR